MIFVGAGERGDDSLVRCANSDAHDDRVGFRPSQLDDDGNCPECASTVKPGHVERFTRSVRERPSKARAARFIPRRIDQ